ncbi:6-phosphogluconolactonase [Hahella sp. SMD15-11]|uniref:6-phosphogluconolactonase n=1 Tax=Thermohahella caldifontis TaxID=3142973 RepID=A0AB39UTF0_9GAMM
MKTPDGLPPSVRWVTAPDRDTLAANLAVHVADQLREQLAAQARVSLAVSGGSTPVPFFSALAGQALPWSRVDVTLVDERWVDADHEASNARLVRTHLLTGEAQQARWVPLKAEGATPAAALDEVEQRVRTLAWPLSVVVLGMGNDGHTASLFPGSPGLAEALDPSGPARVAATRPQDAPHERITLTASALLAARHRVLHITGEDKLATLERALANPDAVAEMPVRLFLKQPLTVFWCP